MNNYRKAAKLHKLICLLLSLAMLMILASCSNDSKEEKNEPVRPTTATHDTATKNEAAPKSATADTAETTDNTEAATEHTAVIEDPSDLLETGRSDSGDSYDATGFAAVRDVIPDVIEEIRYYSDYNFVGERIDGYDEPVALLSKEALVALAGAADDLRDKGYLIKIYDAYRPQRAVSHFAAWANDYGDTSMKEYFYPDVDKSLLFDYGYIAYYSGHSRGSKVDITLVDAATGEDLDMGSTFDYFGSISHPDYTGLTSEQYSNRMVLQNAMLSNGFYSCDTEWWDFTYSGEPYPNTYFDFTVSYDHVIGSYGYLLK